LLPNAFIGALRKPTEKQLATALGEAKPVWDQLLRELARLEVNGLEWTSYSPKAGWALRLKRKQRTIVWLAPCPGHVRVAFILGDKAVEAAREARLPARVKKALAAAPRYPEGTGLRIETKSARGLAAILRLAEIKLAH
jgi:Protein of unknown function (DUF3788)